MSGPGDARGALDGGFEDYRELLFPIRLTYEQPTALLRSEGLGR